MKKYLLIFTTLVCCSNHLLAQQTSSTPPRDEQVVKIATDLIQLDVTVTDRNGKVVTGLTADDFEVFENGEKQKISNLSFSSKTSGSATVADGASANGGANGGAITGPPKPLTAGQVRRTIAIVVDDLNLSFASVYYARRASESLLTRKWSLMILSRSFAPAAVSERFSNLRRISGFFSAAIDRIKWNPLGAGGIEPLTSTAQTAREITDRMAGESSYVANLGNGGSGRTSPTIIHKSLNDPRVTDTDFSRGLDDLSAGAYAKAALGTIKYIVGGMNDLPGRKMMLLISDGLNIRPDTARSQSAVVLEYLKDLVDFTNRSSVVVYTFDTRGMKSMSITASDSTYEVIDGHREQKQMVRLNDFKSSQDGLAYFASQTGGKALLDSNDFNGGITRALEEQSGYYLVGYIPDADTFDATKRKFNKIEVKVNRPGLSVNYRSGFFSTNDPISTSPTLAVERKMVAALTSPFAVSDITLQINALYADDAADGAYIRSFLHIDAKDLTFTEDAEGWKNASFDVTAVTFGDNGQAVENVDSKYAIKTKGATYDAMLKKGFMYVLMMPVKKPGVYQYRVALRDAGSGKIGSASQVIEVPDISKQKLLISSLAVENVSAVIWQNIAAGKVGNGPGQIKVASTLLYDTVLKEYPAGSVLRYGYEVYNAKTDGSSRPQIETQVKILQNNRVIVEGNITKFDASAQSDPKHIRVSNAVMLKDTLAPGEYVLEVTVTDTLAKKKAYQLFPFEIVNK